MPGVCRTRSLACSKESTQASHHRYAETVRHSLRDGLAAYTRSPRSAGLDSLRRRHIIMRQLDASVGSSGPRDFAVRMGYACLMQPTHPSHPASRFVTIGRNVPRVETGCGEDSGISDFQQ